MTFVPAFPDPEIAAATFTAHLDQGLASGPAKRWGWTVTQTAPLEAIVRMEGTREGGKVDEYFLRLRADHYDEQPPQAIFVAPSKTAEGAWREPEITSKWLPNVENNWPDGRFAYHPRYQYPDQHQGQLICCSKSFDYYISSHQPTDGQEWKQGKHTVMALLSRVQQALQPPHYKGPLGDLDT